MAALAAESAVSLGRSDAGPTTIAEAPPPGGHGAADASAADGGEANSPPEPYYWEPGGNLALDFWGKLRHQLHFGGLKAISGAEAIGEVVANALGLNDSKYQYVIDALEADEFRREREEREEDDRRRLEEERERERPVVVGAQPAYLAEVELGDASSAISLAAREGEFASNDVIDVPLT